jgi:hypothetical protein
MCKEQLILSKLQNGIAQEAKLELLTKYGEDRFSDGDNFRVSMMRKLRETKITKIKEDFNQLLDQLRVEIWDKNKGENEVIIELRERIYL